MKFAEELLGHARSSSELAVMLNHDPDTFCPYRDGQHMTLKRLELAIECKQKRVRIGYDFTSDWIYVFSLRQSFQYT